ncbi:MAG: hypothetical protein K8R02_00905 [Anaerohalosphaeraceae bacterium]|nr:hypothetical protein [Anaerohalosphaeraceae bacterium]
MLKTTLVKKGKKMIVLVKANILTVGLGSKSKVLRRLPIRVLEMAGCYGAGRSLKNEDVNSVISHWDLPDAEDGKLLKAIKRAKPNLPLIAVIEPGNLEQEIAARSIGATAVVNSDISDDLFIRIVAETLKLDDAEEITKICASADEIL